MINNLFRPIMPIEDVDVCLKTSTCFYHLSPVIFDEGYVLTPRIPISFPVYHNDIINKLDPEDQFIPRICVSRSIEGALQSLSKYHYDTAPNIRLYVYKILYDNPGTMKVVEPTIRAVHDGIICNELWVTTPINPDHYELVGIVTDIISKYIDPSRVDVNPHTETYQNGYDGNNPRIYKSYNSFPEIYYNYIPYRIVRSPFTKVDQCNNNAEYYTEKRYRIDYKKDIKLEDTKVTSNGKIYDDSYDLY